MNNAITAKILCLWYGSAQALKNINIQIPENNITALIGPSGCGKSTFLKTLNRMNDLIPGVKITGEVRYLDTDIFAPGLDVNALRKEIGMVFQDPMSSLNPVYKVGDQVAEGLIQHTGMSKAQAQKQVLDMFRKLGIPDPESRISDYPHQFSGGMKQRVALARALAASPRILLMDEPFAALDAMTREQLYQDIQEIHLRCGMTIIFVTHNMREAVCLGDRVVLLTPHPGRICEEYFVDFPHPRDINSSGLAELSARITRDLKGATA